MQIVESVLALLVWTIVKTSKCKAGYKNVQLQSMRKLFSYQRTI